MRVRGIITVLFCVALVTGCGDRAQPSSASSPPFADAHLSEQGQQRWARTCALCHVRGEGGAPKVGDADAWTPRLAQWETVLLEHTVNGFGNMPPLGYCMDCEREGLRAAIAFMTNAGRQ